MTHSTSTKDALAHRIRQTSIALRLKGLSLLGIALLAAAGLTAYQTMTGLAANLGDVTATGQALRNHLESDMMHDAIRGDVYGALGRLSGREETEKELRAHAAWFREAVKKNQSIALNPEIHGLLRDSNAKLETYLATAEEICALAFKDARAANRKLPGFLNAFRELEEQNELLSDRIEKLAATTAERAREHTHRSRNQLVLFCGIGAAILFAAAVWIGRSVTRPVERMVMTLERVAKGQLDERAAVEGGEEVARMAAALNDALEQIGATFALIGKSSESIHETSEGMTARSDEISNAAETTATTATRLSSAGASVSQRLESVSASGVELSASIREIAAQAAASADLARQASDAATSANELFTVLEGANKQIGNVVSVISTIANQTNLLALNAAIEAARAGEAGRGFAVVAAEVKELASQTSKSTEEISDRITSVQSQTTEAVESIRSLSKIIASVNMVSSTIAAAVEEQSVVTRGIDEQLQEATTATRDIAESVQELAASARQASQGASESRSATRDLYAIAQSLQQSVATFVVRS